MATFGLKYTFAATPRTTRGQSIVINGDPKGNNFLYCNSNNVYIRNIKDPKLCDVYAEHTKETTVAKYSPSGFYIASGDAAGKVRVWDTTNPEHIIKSDLHVLGGSIKDLDWTSDSQKIVAGGEGREPYAKAFTFDSGNSVGDMACHSKSINSVSIKSSRPFRLATASEDFTSGFFEGPPFKYKVHSTENSNFVNCVRYSPNGEKYATGSSDKKIFVYDGSTGALVKEIGSPAHNGGVYSVCFSPDSKMLVSISGDKTAKVWDVDANTCVGEWSFGTTINDMQVSCLWEGDQIITVSLSGYINYINPNNPGQIERVIKGHNKRIFSLAVSSDGSTFYTGGGDGLILQWNAESGEAEEFKGKGHPNQVTDMVIDGDSLVTVGVDDTIKFSSLGSLEYGPGQKLQSQPKAVAAFNGTVVVASINHISVFSNQNQSLVLPIQYEANHVAISPDGKEVAVGANKSIVLYSLASFKLTEKEKKIPLASVNYLTYSPDGKYLAAASGKKLSIFSLEENFEEILQMWGDSHTASITSLSWASDSKRLLSSSVDAHVLFWDIRNFKGSKPRVKAHPLSCVQRVAWLSPNSLVSIGLDSNVKIWTLTSS